MASGGIDPAGLDRLRDAEAALRLRRHGARHLVIDAAVALLLTGVDVPQMAVVAGDDRVDDRELQQDLDEALIALGVDPMDIEGAALRIATAIAHDVLAGQADKRAAARSLWAIWLDSGSPDNPLAQLAYVADGFVDEPMYFPESALLEAAADFLAQAPTG
jgi:hypothetical protein